MNILILGYGLEGKSAENYFKNDPSLSEHTKIDILDKFTAEDLKNVDYDKYDLIFRTPSVRPDSIPIDHKKITSITKFFFSNCKAKIIGVTGTKGKGTTCTMIRDLLESLEKKVYLLGNIGSPALDALPEITENDIVVYELSSFQLWDLEKSPEISVALRIEPDHLDVHKDFEEYLKAKENITLHQKQDDFLIFFENNEHTKALAELSNAHKLSYPIKSHAEGYDTVNKLINCLKIPGEHNKENAEAALLACFAYFSKMANNNLHFKDFLEDNFSQLSQALKHFTPLPHHIEFVREINTIKYYDDSFSTVYPSLEAAINAFPKTPLVLIAGGKDKGFPIEPVKRLIFNNPYLVKAILIGETSKKIAENEDPEKYYLAGTDFEDAIKKAQQVAESHLEQAEANSDTCLIDAKKPIVSPVVLLSPCASSFDMFESYKQRGDIFKTIVKSLPEKA